MLGQFIGAVIFTVGVSFVCSLLEALILSTTIAEIENLKKRKPKTGKNLEKLISDLSNTIAAILTLNTIANTAGSAIVGGLAREIWGSSSVGIIAGGLTFAILVFSEIIPKNVGVIYRVSLQPVVTPPLRAICFILRPITYLTGLSLKLFVKEKEDDEDGASNEEEIILLAEKGAKEGKLTSDESDMVTNALKLDDVMVSEIMTPRVVITCIEQSKTVGEIFDEHPNIPFARVPVYDEELDNIKGVARRRDLLTQKAEDNDSKLVSEIMGEVQFVPETINVATALETILKTHQQLLVVVDEFGSLAGVVTMEDIMEYIIGREIFEKDDVAIDMRELARTENLKSEEQSPPNS
ncbi:hemolysin family protein [Puniceicoccaceae bacterium K14]|nr:hemolysin family protein [Puniceicoccaceae bacterium K14]